MTGHAGRMTREQLLAALDAGWGRYLPALARMPAGERRRYVMAQGFDRLEDLLAHVFAWWDAAIQRVPAVRSGEQYPLYEADRFNAQTVARYRSWAAPEVEAKFEDTLTAFRDLIAGLSDADLEHEVIYNWAWDGCVDHYDAHRPENG